MHPDQGSNTQPFGVEDDYPTNRTTQPGLNGIEFVSHEDKTAKDPSCQLRNYNKWRICPELSPPNYDVLECGGSYFQIHFSI